jgi:hypothetical protein
MQDNERIIELIAKALDEPLTAQEQAQVDEAMQNSLAIRIAADGLREFDALLKRTGMAIPDEGFPLRVLARLEIHEKRRNRLQWILTLGVLFLGSFAALVWLVLNWSVFINTIILVAASLLLLVPFAFAFLFALVQFIGQGPLLLYALIVLLLTLLWARVSGGLNPSFTNR